MLKTLAVRHRLSLTFPALLLAFAAILAALAVPSDRTAHAQSASGSHEGTAGPHQVVVEVIPASPIVGKVQFRVRPANQSTGVPVTDARIEIFVGRSGHEEIKTPALSSPADPATYTGNVEIDQPGDWAVRVHVESPGGQGDFAFPISVRPRARSGEGLVAPTLVYLGAALIILGGVAWLVRSSRKARRGR